VRACTIIAKNYLAQARVLAESFLKHNPGSSFSVLVIDSTDGYFDPGDEPFTVLTPADIDCEPFWQMASRYDLLELSTAVKPWLLRQQLRDGADSITYLDPDIQVFGSLDELHTHAVRHGLALTPHNTKPIPDDGLKPTQMDILFAGVYNLGYVSVGAQVEVDQLLKWWCDRLTHDCRIDPFYGYFVDQRWFDLAPGFVDGESIVRDTACNVAYWNVHEREITGTDGQYQVDGRALKFFHFSGFDPARPRVLSRHQTRNNLDDFSVVRELCAQYARRAMAHGYANARRWPYTYAEMANGDSVTPLTRVLYGAGEDAGVLSLPIFDGQGCEAFVRWATEQDPESPPGVSRTLGHIYRERSDLQRAFPDLAGGSLEGYLDWARNHAHDEYSLGTSLLPAGASAPRGDAIAPTVESLPPGPAPTPLPRGVNVVGYFRSELGVGEAARQAVRAFDEVGVPLVPLHGATIPLSRQGHSFHHLDPSAARYPVSLVCMNADALPDFARHVGREFFVGRISVGLWFWEVSVPPAEGWDDAFALLDEVWAPTAYVAEAIRAVAPIPVVQVRLPIEMRPTLPLDRETLSIAEGFMFLFSFDYLSVFERKNPLAVVDAYRRAFEPGEDVTLVIKCINYAFDPDNHARLMEAVLGRDDITVIDDYLDPTVKDALTGACDCYVSLHRAEGLGLTMAEAMHLGKPVIATGYSGNVDFMTEDNSHLIDFEMVPIGPDAPPYPPGGTWAQPDVAQAARAMRGVFDDRAAGRALGVRAAESIRETHSARAAGESLADRLQTLYDNHPKLTSVGPQSLAEAQRSRLRGVTRRMPGSLGARLESIEAIPAQMRRVEMVQRRAQATDLPAALHALRDVSELRIDVDALLKIREPILERINDLDRAHQRLEAQAHALPYMDGDPFVVTDEPGVGKVQGYRDATAGRGTDVYRSFEDIFRGSEEFIRERQRRFIPLLDGHGPVLDFGCGRGELLDLLREAGIEYAGVDSDEGMLDRCRAKGHENLELGDGIGYLERCPEASFGAVFCAQVIEHLPFETLVRFFELSRRALRPGGVLIAETVNPHSPSALKAFWVDLTHQHPIFPEVALALTRGVGFERAYVFHPNGNGDIESDRFTTGEYAVVAQTAAEVTST
jgi:glycosyltransferase involved in cell wall biosynthesis/SAM-dependent methyltransferase